MLYVDADALSKLAHWNILPLLPELTGYQWHEIATISSLKHRANRAQEKPDGKLFISIEAARVASVCISNMGQMPNPNEKVMAALAESEQIDSGEALLLAVASTDAKGCILTGDKRALRALAQHGCASIFVGTILVIEQIIFECLQVKGREWILENICPYKNVDKAISNILGSQCDGSMESIVEGINSYITELVRLHDPRLLRDAVKFQN